MIDISNDRILSLIEARAWLGDRMGRPPSVGSLKRWLRTGVRGHVLESLLVGGRRVTSAEAIESFILALSGGVAPTRTARRRREIESARRECDVLFGPGPGGGRGMSDEIPKMPLWMIDKSWTPFLDDGKLPVKWRAVPYLASRFSLDETRRILHIRRSSKAEGCLFDYWSWFSAACRQRDAERGFDGRVS